MNQQDVTSSQSKMNGQFNFDDFEISEETFKALDKGLGFHHENKKNQLKLTPKTTSSIKTSKSSRVKSLDTLIQKEAVAVPSTSSAVPGLEAFYGNSTAVSDDTGSELALIKQSLDETNSTMLISHSNEASSISRLLAWTIDFALVSALVVITTSSLVFASGMKIEQLLNFISVQEWSIFLVTLFSIYYLFYFSILDLSSTPGKTLFGVRVQTIDKSELTFKRTLARSFVSLLSVFLLGLPMILDFQGRLTDTKVAK